MKRGMFVFGVALMALLVGCATTDAAKPAGNTAGVAASYYVRADGSDKNKGTSENAPFQTLDRAVKAAQSSKIKTITVIGKVTGHTTITGSKDLSPKFIYNVDLRDDSSETGSSKWGDLPTPKIEKDFVMENPLIITGKVGASEKERAVLSFSGDKEILKIGQARVVLRDIEISGNKSNSGLGVFNSTIFLQHGVKIRDNAYPGNGGAGVFLINSFLMLLDDAEISDNSCTEGGGIVALQSVIEMQGASRISGNTAAGNGGGISMYGTQLRMFDNSKITGNVAGNFGGGMCSFNYDADNVEIKLASIVTLLDEAEVSNNKARRGGGIVAENNAIDMKENVKVTGNSASERGGGVYLSGTTTTMTMKNVASVTNNIAPEDPDYFGVRD